jgi:hypothetical protein
MSCRYGILLLLSIGIPSAARGQQPEPKLVYDSTGKLVPPDRIAAAARPEPLLPTRRGPWVNLGLGFGSVNCADACSSVAPAVEVAAGWALSPRFSLGAGITGWTKGGKTGEYEGATLRLTVGSLGLRARFYPQQTAGFFISGGLGIGIIRLSDEGGLSSTQTGLGFLAGLGCDLWMTPRMSLTPFLDISGSRAWSADELHADLWRLGLGLTFH